MALTYRFYRSPQVGTGTRADPFRSDLTRFVVEDGSGAGFWDWVNFARPVRYALARCESAVHAAVVADGQSTPLSSELADVAAVTAWLDGPAAGLPQAVVTLLESDGVGLAWVGVGTTVRQVLRYASKTHVITQTLQGSGNAGALAFFAAGLDTAVSTLPAGTRAAIQAWLQAKGLIGALAGLSGANVREIVHYTVQNADWAVLPLGPVSL